MADTRYMRIIVDHMSARLNEVEASSNERCTGGKPPGGPSPVGHSDPTMNRIASPPAVLREIPGPSECEMCGAPGLRTELVRDPFIYGVGDDAVELSADIPVHTCNQCEVAFTGREAEVIHHEAVCRHLGVLTPKEIRNIRRQYGLSRAAFARLTGFGKASLARWERGELIQNTSSDRFLKLLLDPQVFRCLTSLAGLEDADGAPTPAAPPSAMGVVVSIASGR